MKKPLLEIKNLSKTYHTKTSVTTAVEGFSLDVYDCDFIAIVGPSGCGKSTILSILSGLIPQSSGSYTFKDDNTTVGYMLQQDHLFPWRNILDNATLGLEINKILNDSNKENIINLLNT